MTKAMVNGLAGFGVAACFLFAVPARLDGAGAKVLLSGEWLEGGYEIEGGWQILEENGKRFVVLNDEFRTRRAPDLKIFVSPRPFVELTDRNALEGAVRLAVLERFQGSQRYEIEASVDLEGHETIFIQCEEFSKFWGGSPLRPSADEEAD